MPKHEFLTPKAIANRIKAKGLQKLRWYCQMCQKQCRDENGFKCHTMSESHQRQLLLFAENPDKYIDSFSKEFEESFLELLSRRFGTKRVHANQVYQEYITDRNHLHMNATMWETLTEFVKYLGRAGKCIVDQTEKGWFITFIDRDPEAIRRQEQLAKKEKLELDDEEKMAQFIQKQVERAKETIKEQPEPVFTALKRENEEEKFTINLTVSKKKEAPSTPAKILPAKNPLTLLKKKETFRDDISVTSASSSKSGDKRKCALEEIMEEEERQKEKLLRKNYWLAKGIVVKVITKKLGDKYYKKKAVVKDVQDLFAAIIQMLDTGDILKLDQTHLETVIPAQGKSVLVVNGAYRGCEAILMSLNEENFSVKIKINSGLTKGRIIDGVKYEDICKIHIPS